ncbi:MAG: hypothetical protein ACYDHN_12405 [Solirubrobacteraceae bacterium]
MLHAILCLAPAILMAAPLLARRYPGERMLTALRHAPEQHPWPRPRSTANRHRTPRIVSAHGGQLIARSLAVRPPPVALAAS